jgi:hypothetical protein
VTGTIKPQPLQRGHSYRVGSLRDRIERLYFKEKAPPPPGPPTAPSKGNSYHPRSRLTALTKAPNPLGRFAPATKGLHVDPTRDEGSNLVPFLEAVEQTSFTA